MRSIKGLQLVPGSLEKITNIDHTCAGVVKSSTSNFDTPHGKTRDFTALYNKGEVDDKAIFYLH